MTATPKKTLRHEKPGPVATSSRMESPDTSGDETASRYDGLWQQHVLNLRERLLFVLDRWMSGRGRYKYYESVTGIPASRWQNLCLEKQLPTVDMVMAVAMFHPVLAEWLIATGTADNRGLEQYGGVDAWESFLKDRTLTSEYRAMTKRKRGKRS